MCTASCDHNSAATPDAGPAKSDAVSTALKAAAATIAPVWPLDSFVAVNPYFGHADKSYLDAGHHLERVAGARRTMDRSYYADLLRTGKITEADIEAACQHLDSPYSREEILSALQHETTAATPTVRTVADIADDYFAKSWSDAVLDSLSAYLGRFFDAGQAAVQTVNRRHMSLWQSWRDYAATDYSLDLLGAKGARQIMRQLDTDRDAAVAAMLSDLSVPGAVATLYLERLLRTVGGWAAAARQADWLQELDGEGGLAALQDLAAARLAYDWMLFACFDIDLSMPWQSTLLGMQQDAGQNPTLLPEDVLHEALEIATKRSLVDRFQVARSDTPYVRPDVQAAFCIDVRSEVIRRAFETAVPNSETLGFAGFFGFAIEVQPLGAEQTVAQCPVLLKPTTHIREEGGCKTDAPATARRNKARLRRAMKRFKNSAVGSFAFVDVFGIWYGVKLLSDALGITSPAPLVSGFGLDSREDVTPGIAPSQIDGTVSGIAPADRVDMAESVLRAMSLTRGFGRKILLVGHGSVSRNNPHAAGLDCGACGGNSGEINARVAAAILNDRDVRAGLVGRGITVPADSYFYGAVHNTVTDDITIFDSETGVLDSDGSLARLRDSLNSVAATVRRERAPQLWNTAPTANAAELARRGEDWAQVRPEWGLAGCNSFIAAPRHRSVEENLTGKTFLHSYNWQDDEGFKILELIMTAPMVVASWINLQYFASTLDNQVFGSGDKTLHNVTGRMGVLEGHGGDLRTGLPMQSIHDGTNFVHTPTRLNVVLEAPVEAINAIIGRHSHIRDLVDNGWIGLFVMDDKGRISDRYVGDLRWTPAQTDKPMATAPKAA